MARPAIRNYLIAELEEMLLRKPAKPHLRRLFSPKEIQAEIDRRNEISLKRQDRLRYPELQPSFH